jgi:hypothetical protein
MSACRVRGCRNGAYADGLCYHHGGRLPVGHDPAMSNDKEEREVREAIAWCRERGLLLQDVIAEAARLREVIRTGGAMYRAERAALGIPGGIDPGADRGRRFRLTLEEHGVGPVLVAESDEIRQEYGHDGWMTVGLRVRPKAEPTFADMKIAIGAEQWTMQQIIAALEALARENIPPSDDVGEKLDTLFRDRRDWREKALQR